MCFVKNAVFGDCCVGHTTKISLEAIQIIPVKEELLTYLKENPHQTYTSLAKHFDLEMGTVRDLVKMYKESLTVLKIGTALMVDVKEGEQ